MKDALLVWMMAVQDAILYRPDVAQTDKERIVQAFFDFRDTRQVTSQEKPEVGLSTKHRLPITGD